MRLYVRRKCPRLTSLSDLQVLPKHRSQWGSDRNHAGHGGPELFGLLGLSPNLPFMRECQQFVGDPILSGEECLLLAAVLDQLFSTWVVFVSPVSPVSLAAKGSGVVSVLFGVYVFFLVCVFWFPLFGSGAFSSLRFLHALALSLTGA